MITKTLLAEKVKQAMLRYVREHGAEKVGTAQRSPYMKNYVADDMWPLLRDAWQQGWDACSTADFRHCVCEPTAREDWCSCWRNPYREG